MEDMEYGGVEQEPTIGIHSVPHMHYTLRINQAEVVRSDLLVDESTPAEFLRGKFYIMEEMRVREARDRELEYYEERLRQLDAAIEQMSSRHQVD
jgi:hypothetical protein